MITIDEIIRLANKNNISAYNISKNTSVSERAVGMILNKEVKRPHATTLTDIYEYLISIDTDTEILSKEYPIDLKDKVEITGFYYPDVSSAAGMDKEIINDELKRIPISLPNWEKGIDFINVYGDSMYPKFCSGEIIGIKEVEVQYLNYGFAYVVILNDGQVLLKFIKKSKKEFHIILESENKFYEPKEYHIEQIKKVYIIKGVITKTTM